MLHHPEDVVDDDDTGNGSSVMPPGEKSSPFRVIGIAFVVDKLGVGPRMVLRYPSAGTTIDTPDHTTKSTTTTTGPNVASGVGSIGGGGSSSVNINPSNTGGIATPDLMSSSKSKSDQQDLFFRLPPRQMAKLFRPKPALCGQPMTLSVGGTIFCCCAVLMDDDEQQQTSTNHLVLFSIIVALSPQVKASHGSIPISGWIEENTTTTKQGGLGYDDLQSLLMVQGKLGAPSTRKGRASSSFLCIRRVHVSLARLCRILEREERRCQYISIQTDQFERVRHDLEKKWRSNNNSNNNNNNSMASKGRRRQSQLQSSSTTTAPLLSSPKSTTSAKSTLQFVSNDRTTAVGGNVIPSHHRRSNSISFGGTNINTSNDRNNNDNTNVTSAFETTLVISESELKQQLLELEQEILETIMAESPMTTNHDNVIDDDDDDDEKYSNYGWIEHQGNLARELVQVYHALTRNDYDFPPAPSILMSGRDSVVYINRHIAVAIESVAPNQNNNYNSSSWCHGDDDDTDGKKKVTVRPYQTLLFPDVTPTQLLESMMTSSRQQQPSVVVTPRRRLQQLLRMMNPQKSLSEISLDANLPLSTTLDIASYLVSHGACLVSLPITRNVRFAVPKIDTIHQVSLSFSQQFGTMINLFILVSFLSSSEGSTLGDVMKTMSSSSTMDPSIVQLRHCLERSLSCYQQHADPNGDGSSHNMSDIVVGARRVGSSRYDDGDDLDRGIIDDDDDHPDIHVSVSELRDELLYQMVVWLCSHKVLVPLQEYLIGRVAPASCQDMNSNEPSGNDMTKRNDNHPKYNYTTTTNQSVLDNSNLEPVRGGVGGSRISSGGSASTSSMDDPQLLQELFDADCLSGKVSIQACCWRTGMDPMKLMSFVRRCPRIRLVSRLPEKGDDWGAL